MISFTNIFIACVATCFISVQFQDPALFLARFTEFATLVYYSFSFNQWCLLILFYICFTFLPILCMTMRRPKGFRYDGRQYIAQALGTTSEQNTVGATSDETNTDAANGLSPQKTETIQTQVAPNLLEKCTLATATTMMPYSAPAYLGQSTFGTTNVIGDIPIFYESRDVCNRQPVAKLFADHRFTRFDIRFTVNVTGNPFATGMLAFACLPYKANIPGGVESQDGLNAVTWTDYYDRVVSMNHVLADVSQDGVYTLDLPYTSHSSWLSSAIIGNTAANRWGELIGVVISPYLPPTGSTSSINIEVYATLINIEMMEVGPYVTQSLLNFGSETTVIENKLENVNSANIPTNISGDHLSATVPTGAGLDNPPDPRNPETSVFRIAYQKIAQWMGKLDVIRTSSAPGEVADVTAAMADNMRLGVDEMSMDFFRGRWFSPEDNPSNIAVTTGTTTGSLLGQFALAPRSFASAFGANFGTDNSCDFAQWLCSFFKFWRGSLKFRVVISSNNFKRGKLLICINYSTTQFLPSNFTTTNVLDPRSLPHIIVDLSNADRFVDIDVPYKAVYEMLRMPRLVGNSTSMLTQECIMGQLGIYLASPLQVSNGTSTQINLNVFEAWGPDFELFTQTQGSEVGYVAQSHLTAPGPTTLNLRSHMLRPFSNLKELMQRPVCIGTYPLNFPGAGNPAGYTPLIIPIHPTFSMTKDALWGGLMAAYSGLRGGYRIMIRFANVNVTTSCRVAYFENLFPTDATGAFIPNLTSGATNYDYSALNTNQGAFVQQNGNYNVNSEVQATFQNSNLNVAYNLIPSGTAARGILNGIPSFTDHIVDPYSQPEVILEVPDPSPIYRTQQTTPLRNGWSASGIPYDATKDRNIGFLVIMPVDNQLTNAYDEVLQSGTTVTVSMMAADDTRFFWYNGGPTSILPLSVGYYKAATPTVASYINMIGT